MKGAYSAIEVYTPDDVSDVVRYAKDRGVRVMMELDTPGHAASFGAGYPEIMSDCPETVADLGDAYQVLDPTSNATYDLLGQLLAELGALAPDAYFRSARRSCPFVLILLRTSRGRRTQFNAARIISFGARTAEIGRRLAGTSTWAATRSTRSAGRSRRRSRPS